MAYNSEKFDRMIELIKEVRGSVQESRIEDENHLFSVPSFSFHTEDDHIEVDPYCMYSKDTSRVYKNFHGFDYPTDIIQLKLILKIPIIN